MVTTQAYGSWPSPLTPKDLTSAKAGRDVTVDAATASAYWVQVVPAEDGRGQVFQRSLAQQDGEPRALLPLGYNCRTRVHEYGSGEFSINGGLLVFSNDTDGAVYTLDMRQESPEPVRLTPVNRLLRYGDFCIDKEHRFVVCVQEEHFENEEPKDVINRLVVIQLDSGKVKTVAEGADFYASPRIANHSQSVAFLSWVHPNMPWDFTQLSYGSFTYSEEDSFVLGKDVQILNPGVDESVIQPEFGVDDTLYFVSDRSGFWNLYRLTNGQFDLLLEAPLEQDFAASPWGLNMRFYMPFKTDATKLACTNKGKLAVLDVQAKTLTDVPTDYTLFSYIATYAGEGNCELIVANACSTTRPTDLIAYDATQKAVFRVLKPTSDPSLDPAYISIGEEVAFPTTDGLTAYCYFYAPKNPDFRGPAGQLPPLRVMLHGGPTAHATNAYSSTIQYWTSRGFAIADVNYGGSDGYGREYRNRLIRKWGIVDVDDCCNAALYLADQGRVDREKLSIEGGSAGGYTTLAAIAFRDVFKAGISLYGISDMNLLAAETHKFESRYTDRLVGEYPAEKAIYDERSPIHKADNIKCPVIFFQGEEDKVVPPSQAEIMVNTMREKGLPVAYVLYPGEGHGFRRAENIARTLELQQWFLGQIFGFEVDGIEGVPIDNFPPK
ncbi:Alpha/Beta hydrolase protein [Gongronella butleri]|nr:Alpha/Beta hydrolase protein [Gongronella butleri]